MHLARPSLEREILSKFDSSPVLALLGARQTGKTTLARRFASQLESVHFFDLESPADRAALSTPELTLGNLTGTVIIDEVQRMPAIFEVLRPLCDRPEGKTKFLLLGSASPKIIRGVSESLAGRVLFINVSGFSLAETGVDSTLKLWERGGFPRSYLAQNQQTSMEWRDAFIETFLERDLPQLGIRIASETIRRFWHMIAHYHAQTWNSAQFAKSLSVSSPTARSYLDILAGTYMLRILPPWFENLKKRQVRSPKIYIRDSGILHSLLGVESLSQLRRNPAYGASWEGFALEQVLINYPGRDAYFWGTQRGAELDLFLMYKGRRLGFEFKCADAPSMTRSMHIAIKDLNLDYLYVIYPGGKSYPLTAKAEVIPLHQAHFI